MPACDAGLNLLSSVHIAYFYRREDNDPLQSYSELRPPVAKNGVFPVSVVLMVVKQLSFS